MKLKCNWNVHIFKTLLLASLLREPRNAEQTSGPLNVLVICTAAAHGDVFLWRKASKRQSPCTGVVQVHTCFNTKTLIRPYCVEGSGIKTLAFKILKVAYFPFLQLFAALQWKSSVSLFLCLCHPSKYFSLCCLTALFWTFLAFGL